MAKYSDQVRREFPYLLPLIEKVIRHAISSNGGGGGGGGSGVGGAPSPHVMSSSHHTGSISNAQGPQFLLSDGTRTLAGHLDVDPGIQIDGVDLSLHVTLPDVHHDRATSGNTGISLSGQAIYLQLATTSGLSITGSGLVVGAGDGIDVLTNTVAVDVTDIINTSFGIYEPTANDIGINKGDGLVFTAGQLTLGEPTQLTVNSTNLVSPTSHSHAILTNSNVGDYGDIGAYILASTPSGGLTLNSLSVTGTVNITDGGDLLVGPGTGTLFVDVSQNMVGIGQAEGGYDAQFALDVAGPIRGTEIVGKHAIQLDDLALLLHFDGGHPYESNYTGEPNAIPMGRPPTNLATSNILYRPGKFYKNAVFGKVATNLISNPSFELNTTGWTVAVGSGTGWVLTRDTTQAYVGLASARLSWTTGDLGEFYTTVTTAAANQTHALGMWMKCAVTQQIQVRMMLHGAPFTNYASNTVTVTEDWQYFSVASGLIPPTTTLRVGIVVPVGSGANSVWVDAVQLEIGTPSWYFDGSMATANAPYFAWNGTAHASSSTKSVASSLTYALADMVRHRWSVMGWFAWPFSTPPPNNGMFSVAFAGGGERFEIFANSTGIIAGTDGGSGFAYNTINAGPFVPGTYCHVAATYTPGHLRFFWNGEWISERVITFGFAPATVTLGMMSGPANPGEVKIDDFCVSRQALPDARIRAVYESDAQVFASSSVFHFRATPKGLVWADEEGLWMRNSAGGFVLGAYGGESTKNWGGVDLSPSDIIFGDSNRGAYMLWDDSLGDLVIGQTGIGSSNLYLNGSSIKINANGFERFSVTNAGLMEIKDSSGAAVFTFDTSAGAEFTKPLTLGTAGGIWQGTGTFGRAGIDAQTGLKIWREANIGRIAGYHTSSLTPQWSANTSGQLTAGNGAVVLDIRGITIAGQAATIIDADDYTPVNSLVFEASSTVIGWLTGARYGSGVNHQVTLAAAPPLDTQEAELYLFASAVGLVVGGSIPRIKMNAGQSSGSTMVIDAQTITIGHSTITATTLNLRGGAISFDGNNSATNFYIANVITTAYGATNDTHNAPLLVENSSSTTSTTAGIGFRANNGGGTPQRAYFGVVSQASGFAPDVVLKQRNGTSTYMESLRVNSAGALSVPYIWNTALTGTAVMITSTGILTKNTSSQRYKRNIRDMDESYGAEFLLGLRPVSYQEKRRFVGDEIVDYAEDEASPDAIGLIAEEVYAAGGAAFVTLDGDGIPDNLHYDRLVAPLIAACQRYERRIAALEQKLL